MIPAMYKWLYTHLGGRPWTHITREVVHRRPFEALLWAFLLGNLFANLLPWYYELIIGAGLAAGIVTGHIFWTVFPRSRETSLAYAAGILDGEGTIAVYPQIRGGKKIGYYTLQVSVTNTDVRLVEWLYETFGGKVYRKGVTSAGNRYYRWASYSNEAAVFINSVAPYLVIKRLQAELALEFQSLPGKGTPEKRVRQAEIAATIKAEHHPDTRKEQDD